MLFERPLVVLRLTKSHSWASVGPPGNPIPSCWNSYKCMTARFDTIKVRLQTAPKSQFSGPLDCVLQTFRKEGLRGFYKGATPPLVGWMFMDSLYASPCHSDVMAIAKQCKLTVARMLGSLSVYRRLLHEHVFNPPPPPNPSSAHVPAGKLPELSVKKGEDHSLPPIGHAMAGILAGWTVSFIAAPVEHVKAKLQVQYAADKKSRLYTGPIDCAKKIVCGIIHDFSFNGCSYLV